MKYIIKSLVAMVAAFCVVACGPQYVQPIQSLSDVHVGKMNVENVYVRLGAGFNSQIHDGLAKEKAELEQRQGRLDELNARRRVTSSTRQKVQSDVDNQQKKVTRLESEIINIPIDVKAGVIAALENQSVGATNVNLNLEINSFKLTNGGAVMMIGGSDSMNATVTIYEASTNNKMGVYSVTDLDSNAAGGLLGVMVRGTDPRGDMIKQFSEKVVSVLYTLSDGKKFTQEDAS